MFATDQASFLLNTNMSISDEKEKEIKLSFYSNPWDKF